jgi:DNA-binding MarR family transcriptional regulator
VAASKLADSQVGLLRAYLDAVTLSEALQTRLWQAAQLTLAQVRALRRLAKDPKPLGQLGTELTLAPPSVTRLADRLEERGLIERVRGDEDRRKVIARLTPAGRSLVSAVPPLLDGTAIGDAVRRMDQSDCDRIATALRDFTAAVRLVEDELAQVEVEA